MYNDRNEKSEMITKGVAGNHIRSRPACAYMCLRDVDGASFIIFSSLSFSSCVSVPISSLTLPQVQGVCLKVTRSATCAQKQVAGDRVTAI
jgi:hypothetical protein